MPETVRLRGHHLLCVLPYVGKGYTPEFVENFDAVVAKMSKGAAIEIVAGPDDLCAAMHDKNGPVCESGEHCLKQSAVLRDGKAIGDVGAALGLRLEVGFVLKPGTKDYARLRHLFAEGKIRAACEGCEWHGICTDIAANGFKNVRLMPE
ncbi:MAG: DUF1284 domain-containing protein [Alphaproteobacteria bacterium]|nr:DUF1284 domain-containing protein [Alphaproteobacteria bacterium]